MKIFQAFIAMATPFETLNDCHSEFGMDKTELIRRLKAAAEEIAPIADWKITDHGENEFTAEFESNYTFYQAACCEVELVC